MASELATNLGLKLDHRGFERWRHDFGCEYFLISMIFDPTVWQLHNEVVFFARPRCGDDGGVVVDLCSVQSPTLCARSNATQAAKSRDAQDSLSAVLDSLRGGQGWKAITANARGAALLRRWAGINAKG